MSRKVTIPADVLEGDTTYWWRARHRDENWGWSEWSAKRYFSTVTPYIARPSLVSPSEDTSHEADSDLTLECSSFEVVNGDDTFKEAVWELYTDSQDPSSESPLWSTTKTSQSTQATIPADELEGDTAYQWRVRHVGEQWGESEWSVLRDFSTIRPHVAQPTLVSPEDDYEHKADQDLTVECSEFEVLDGDDTFKEAIWELYTDTQDPDDDSPIWTTTITDHQTQATIPASEFSGDSGYQWRVRHVGEEWGESGWSDTNNLVTATPYVAQPSITSPDEDNSYAADSDLTLEGSDFEVIDGDDSFNEAEWELYVNGESEPSWTTTTSDTSATVPADELEGDTDYEVRVRYQGEEWGWSEWSSKVGFSTKKPYVAQPTNQSPSDDATDISHESDLTLESSDFEVTNGDDSLNEAEWELYVSGDSSPFWTTTTTNTTATVSSTELDGDTEYEWRVRYQGEEWGWSDWSDKTSFTTEDPYVAQPDNLNPNDGESGFEEEDITLEASDFEVVGGSDTFQEAHWEVWKKGSGEDIDTSSVSPQDSELIFSTKSPSIRRPDGKSPSKDEQHVLFSNGLTLRSSDFKINGDYDGELACEFKLYRSEDDKLLWEKTTDQLEVDVPADQLEYGSDYYWQVRHYDPQERLEASNWSKPVTFTTLSDPSSYTYLTTENGKLRKRYGHALSESIRSKSYEHTFDGLALGADGKLYAAHTTEISRIDADTLEIETTVDALSSKACAFTADSDNYLFVGYDSGLIERIDSQDFGVISTYDEPAEPIRQLQVVDDDNLYAIDDTLTLHKLEIDTDTKVIDSAEQIDLSELTDKTIVEVAIDQQGMVLLLLEDSKLVRIDPDNEDTLAETYLDISSVDGIYVDRANKVHISSTEETYELLDALELTQLKIADSGAQRLTDAV